MVYETGTCRKSNRLISSHYIIFLVYYDLSLKNKLFNPCDDKQRTCSLHENKLNIQGDMNDSGLTSEELKLFNQGIEEFNNMEYFESHETLEDLWRGYR